MTSNRWQSWRAQEPSTSFTERTVAALARERRRRVAFPARRWAIVGALAAVMVGGAAWGLAGFPLREPPRAAPPLAATIDLPPAPLPEVVHAPPVEVATPAPPSSPSAPRRKVEAPPPASSADAGRRVVLPRCFCSPKEAICDCF
jgi:hypothetical protein